MLQKIKFIGRVYPSGTHIGVTGMPTIRLQITELAHPLDVTIKITDSLIELDCLCADFREEHLALIWAKCVGLTGTIVNLTAFKLGIGLIIVLGHWSHNDGPILATNLLDPALAPLVTAVSDSATQLTLIEIILREPEISLALNDLILAITMPDHTLINCARSIEAIRHLVAGRGTEPKKAWPAMRHALNLTEDYIRPITSNSADHRHGNPVVVPVSTRKLVTQRSWIIMDRFLHYKRRGSKQLPITEFPMLTG